jgi:thiol-disulfide isomerase/thioredoxin
MWLDRTEKVHAPEVGRTWINASPATMRELRGQAVLIDFWDYTCVNCIRTLPYIREWYRRYAGLGLMVIGVHTPEFEFAREPEYVRRAVRQFDLEYPIVLDNDYQIWQAYSNRCWPAKYLVDKDGYVRYYHFGEGSYGETEAAIQSLLREINPQVTLPSLMDVVRPSDRPGARYLPVTPELYLGFSRGRLGNQSGYEENGVKDYQAGDNYLPTHAYLEGPWFAGRESIEACPLEKRPSRIVLPYSAAEVNLVMSPPDTGTGVLTVSVNGRPLHEDEAGEDIKQLNDDSEVTVREPRMYRLVRTAAVESKLLEVSTCTPGLEAYAFTFVSCADSTGA